MLIRGLFVSDLRHIFIVEKPAYEYLSEIFLNPLFWERKKAALPKMTHFSFGVVFLTEVDFINGNQISKIKDEQNRLSRTTLGLQSSKSQ